jgi:hypothetical protein
MAQGGYILPRFGQQERQFVMVWMCVSRERVLPSEERQSNESKRQFWREIFKTEKWQR